MIYLLDTNACIALIDGDPPAVRARLQRVLSAGARALVPSLVAYELWYGVAKSARQEINAARVQVFFAGPVGLLPFDEEDARVAGAIRARLEAAGRPIGAYDILIAGQAVRHKLTLVTANTKEFRRIRELAFQDWAKT